MNEFKGTKYHWTVSENVKVNEQGVPFLEIDSPGAFEVGIAAVYGGGSKMNANAVLMSKAPEMLEKLIEISKTAERVWKINEENEFFDEIDFSELDDLIKEATEI
ncbi:hypothetical protein [Chryseobacterium culicis]|uniref:hypothetical protein n=1 Tax=Chryseobacterium culicis TaxID=680127 RepID=UPI0018774C20|nr:hypothetical protein [Chryseobacterium culicis]MBE4949950.1 hypothetical protein [Chryseobacterium culicis]